MKFINRDRRFYTIGVDIFEPYIREAKSNGIHDDYVLCDVRYLPFKKGSVDAVLSMEVLEHMERDEGIDFLKSMQGIAKKQVIISTPAGNYKQDPYDGNLHQEHKYCWTPREMKELGLKVTPLGIRNLGGKSNGHYPFSRLLSPLVDILWVAAGPISRIFPRLAGGLVCETRAMSQST